MSEKIVSVQRLAEIAEQYAAKQESDVPGMQIASVYRCIATVFRHAANKDADWLAQPFPRKGQIGNE